MNKDIKSLSYEICVNTDDAKEKLDEIKKIIDSIDFHFKGLKKAVNDLENYNSKFEIKYSFDACSSKSFQVLKDENKDNKDSDFVKFSIAKDISVKDIEDLKLFIEDRLN